MHSDLARVNGMSASRTQYGKWKSQTDAVPAGRRAVRAEIEAT